MPDWSYRTLFRPLLQKLPPRLARKLTLRGMGTVSKLPGGTLLIRTLGHMEPTPLLETRLGDVELPTPVGLSGEVDPDGLAQGALAQLGFGFVEIGPVIVTDDSRGFPTRVLMDHGRETILYPDGPEAVPATEAIRRIRSSRYRLPQFARVVPPTGVSPEQAAERMERLIRDLDSAGAAGYTLDILSSRPDWKPEDCSLLTGMISKFAGKPFLLYVPADYPDDAMLALVRSLDFTLWEGIVIGNGKDGANRQTVAAGPQHLGPALRKIRLLRERIPGSYTIQAAAGIHEPQDALNALEAGADHVLAGSGFVYAGPGLPKRINDAVLHEKTKRLPEPPQPSFWQHWGWMCLLGIGMILGGAIAWLIAVSTVLLPYDEAFLGMSQQEIRRINPHLLHFMSHDRITLAGTMLSIGILYYQLAKHGLRHGQHWARTALLVSCLIGFPSFFLYLGYGFFDPLHATAAAVLLPMFLLSMRKNPDRPSRDPVNLRSDRIWKRAVWGQLCFVVLGVSLCIGGLTIAGVGITGVFVPTDLAYLNLTAAQINEINPRLIPLIAHDRAGFGGALLSDAAALLATALWGIQQGARWLWKTLLFGGAPAFIAALSVHFEIGYTDTVHLLPAYFAVFLYVAGLVLLYPYMTRKPAAYSPSPSG